MKLSEAFRNFSDIEMALAGLGIFLLVFLGILFFAWSARDEDLRKLSRFPLED